MTRPTRLGKSTGSSVYMPVKAREDPIPSVILSTVAATMNNHPSGKSWRNLHTWVKTQLNFIPVCNHRGISYFLCGLK